MQMESTVIVVITITDIIIGTIHVRAWDVCASCVEVRSSTVCAIQTLNAEVQLDLFLSPSFAKLPKPRRKRTDLNYKVVSRSNVFCYTMFVTL